MVGITETDDVECVVATCDQLHKKNVLEKTSFQDHMQSRATREAINANTEALKETTRVAREATEMMRASNIAQEAEILDGARRR